MRKYSFLLFLLLSSTASLLYCSGPTEPELNNPYDEESDSYIPNMPSLTTTEPYDIGGTFARTGGSITDDGGADITAAGVCYVKGDETPDLIDICITVNVESNTFEVLLEDLVLGETYTVRAYATSQLATAWGEGFKFVTLNFNVITNPATGQRWMDRNLGASRAEAYGDLYQWGRSADGHQNRYSSTTSTLSSRDEPGHGDFILGPDSPYDWRSPQNDDLWQGVDGINNPCPDGYRLPTEAEWEAERESWDTNDAYGAFNSPLKLPVAGFRSRSSGSLRNVGSYGNYWSGTVAGSLARRLYFGSGNASMSSGNRANGNSVRCLQN